MVMVSSGSSCSNNNSGRSGSTNSNDNNNNNNNGNNNSNDSYISGNEAIRLGRLSLTQERQLNLLPKPSNPLEELKRDVAASNDPLVKTLVRYQENLQRLTAAFTSSTATLLACHRQLSQGLRQVTGKWNDGGYLPIGGLSVLAAGSAWRSRAGKPNVAKIAASAAAVSLTWLICLPQLRDELANELVPDRIKAAAESVFMGFGLAGAHIWSRAEEGVAKKIRNKL